MRFSAFVTVPALGGVSICHLVGAHFCIPLLTGALRDMGVTVCLWRHLGFNLRRGSRQGRDGANVGDYGFEWSLSLAITMRRRRSVLANVMLSVNLFAVARQCRMSSVISPGT